MSRSAALRLARSVVDAAARPVSGDPSLVKVELSVRAMAAEAGLSAGTVQKHLRLLDELGVRVDAESRLYSLNVLEDLEAGVQDPLPPGREMPRSEHSGPERLGPAFEALCQLVEADPRQLQSAQETALSWLREVANQSPTRVAQPRDQLRDSEPTARPMRDGSRAVDDARAVLEDRATSSDLDEPINPSISSSASVARASDRAATSRSDEVFDALLAPLVEACDRMGLPGVTNSVELARRLDCYGDDQVRYAVHKLLVEANNGLRKPVGKLANVADERSRDYFPVDPPPVRLPGDASPVELMAADVASPARHDAPAVDVPAPDLSVRTEGLAMVRERLESMRYRDDSN